jgi:uncharacterized membrane protein YhaH (DUF805 family)
MNWYVQALKKYAVFSGRARRMEYWMFAVINFIISFSLSMIDMATGTGQGYWSPLATIYGCATVIPSLAVGVRRLHDTGKSGWWLLIGLVPILGVIVLIVLFAQDSQPGANQYGPNPKEIAAA